MSAFGDAADEADMASRLACRIDWAQTVFSLSDGRAVEADKMLPEPFARVLFVGSVCMLLGQMPQPAFAQTPLHLTPAQTISPADMTKTELDYYGTLDSAAGQSFIVTRSYVRLAKQVLDHKLPPLSFPARKPEGFTVKYLLPDDPSVINQALGEYLKAKLAADARH